MATGQYPPFGEEKSMSQLQQRLRHIVSEFVSSVVDVMNQASLRDLADNTGGSVRNGASNGRGVSSRPSLASVRRPAAAGKRHRSTAAEVQRQKDIALSAAKALSPGFRKGDVMRRSRSNVDLGRALSLLVRDGVLTRKGDRRKA